VRAGLKILHSGGEQPPKFSGQNSGRNGFGEKDGAGIRLVFHHVAADENRGDLRAQSANAGDQAGTVDAGHSGVGDDGGNFVDLFAGGFEALGAILAGDHFISCRLQNPGKQEANRTIVFNHQNGSCFGAEGAICASWNHSHPTCWDPGAEEASSRRAFRIPQYHERCPTVTRRGITKELAERGMMNGPVRSRREVTLEPDLKARRYSQPLARARRAASTRLEAPSLLMASDK
jgi:hypothetical protein